MRVRGERPPREPAHECDERHKARASAEEYEGFAGDRALLKRDEGGRRWQRADDAHA